MPVTWPQVRQSFPLASESPLLSCLVGEESGSPFEPTSSQEKTLLSRGLLLAAEPEERQQLLQSYLSEQVARVLGLSIAKLDVQQPLSNLGLDSLMAVELKNRLAVDLGISIPVVKFLQGLSVHQLATQGLDLFTALPSAGPTLERALITTAGQTSPSSLYPLSYGQRTMWFLYQLVPDIASYGVPVVVRIHTEVDVPALCRAFQTLVDRHPSFRTTYAFQDGIPAQQIHSHMRVSFQEEDTATWSASLLNDRLIEEIHRPFDLAHGPLLRVHLFTQSENEHLLLLTAHHIAVDFWSLDIVLDELRVLYPAERAGVPAPLPPLRAQYTDYAAWQAALLAGPDGERLWTYWQRQLEGKLSVLNLPTDRPRLPTQTYHGAPHSFRLDQELVQQLKTLAKAEGVTLYTLLLTAFYTLLYRHTGQDNIIVGVPMVGRSRAEFEEIVGYCANPVPLPADLSGNPTFTELLGQVRGSVAAALEHQDYPVELMVERLQLLRDRSRTPLFQVLFGWDKPRRLEEQRASLNGADGTESWLHAEALVSGSFAVEYRVTVLDLVVIVFDAGSTLHVLLQYNTDLFDAATIARLASHFHTMLKDIIARPTQHISFLPLLTPGEQQQLVVEWNDTQQAYPTEQCLHELFALQAERSPHTSAVICADQHLTYQELNTRANQLAHYLQALGVGPDVPVVLLAERSLGMLVGVLGILKAGGAYVPLDPAHPQERLTLILQDIQATVIVTDERLAATLPPHTAQVVRLDTDWPLIAQHTDTVPHTGVTPQHLAYVIYTSGSTGVPKGVAIEHRSVVNHNCAVIQHFALRPADRVLQFHSLSFDAAVEELFPSWLSGAAVVLRAETIPGPGHELHHLIERERLTVLNLPTAYWHEWVGALSQDQLPLPPSLRLVVIGGDEAAPERLATWHQITGTRVRLINTYGPTEATVIATLHEPLVSAHAGDRAPEVPIGRRSPTHRCTSWTAICSQPLWACLASCVSVALASRAGIASAPISPPNDSFLIPLAQQ